VLGQPDTYTLEVGTEGDEGGEWSASQGPAAAQLSPRPRLELVNDADEPRTFVVEEHERDVNALRPADVFAEPSFREHFSNEHLGIGVALDVGVQTILFTDVVGSTRFYLDAGDAAAFAEIRKQFVLAYPVVEKHDGVVVKTIGDAIMGAFRSPLDAVAAAIEMQRVFDGEGDCALRIRVTLHCGPCLAVNLNTGVDYFGTTVNLAAKIQSMAEAGEITWTSDVHADSQVQGLLEREGFAVEELAFELKDGTQATTLYRIKVS
jgi:class 3 adenylate cyclase